MNIKDLVKNTTARFSFFRDGELYYDIFDSEGKKLALFPVNITDKEEIGSATFSAEMKAIMLMRYIRKALEKETIFIYK